MVPIFLSYARGDDEPFAERLYEDLTKAGFEVRWERIPLPRRQIPFHHEIANTTGERDRFVFVAGAKAGISDSIRQEYRWAPELGRPVISRWCGFQTARPECGMGRAGTRRAT